MKPDLPCAEGIVTCFDPFSAVMMDTCEPSLKVMTKPGVMACNAEGVRGDFYQLFLCEIMLYACAYSREPEGDLAQAQRDKLDLVCRNLRLSPGEEHLDIGCGWAPRYLVGQVLRHESHKGSPSRASGPYGASSGSAARGSRTVARFAIWTTAISPRARPTRKFQPPESSSTLGSSPIHTISGGSGTASGTAACS